MMEFYQGRTKKLVEIKRIINEDTLPYEGQDIDFFLDKEKAPVKSGVYKDGYFIINHGSKLEMKYCYPTVRYWRPHMPYLPDDGSDAVKKGRIEIEARIDTSTLPKEGKRINFYTSNFPILGVFRDGLFCETHNPDSKFKPINVLAWQPAKDNKPQNYDDVTKILKKRGVLSGIDLNTHPINEKMEIAIKAFAKLVVLAYMWNDEDDMSTSEMWVGVRWNKKKDVIWVSNYYIKIMSCPIKFKSRELANEFVDHPEIKPLLEEAKYLL